MMNTSLNSRHTGIGMIELLITLLLVSLAVLGLGRSLNMSAQYATNTKASSEALALAEHKMEELRDFSTSSDYSANIVNSISAEEVTGTNALFSTTWEISEQSDPGYKEALVTVNWEDRDGTHTTTLRSIIADEEPVKAGRQLLAMANTSVSQPPPEEEGESEEIEDEEQDDSAEENAEEAVDEEETTEVETESETAHYYITIAGSVSTSGSAQLNGISASPDAACTVSDNRYACELGPINEGQGWSGSLTVATNKTACGGPFSFNDLRGNTIQDIALANSDRQCP